MLFPDTPVVFSGSTDFRASIPQGRWGFTGILENDDIKGTIEIALKIRPDTQNIAVVSDIATSRLLHQTLYYQQKAELGNRINFIDLCRLYPSQLKDRLKNLPDHTITFYQAYYQVPDGLFFSVPESTALVFKHSKRPIYSLWKHTVGHGIAGGIMIKGEWQGRKAAE